MYLECPRCGYRIEELKNLHRHFERKYVIFKPKITNIPFEDLFHVFYNGQNTTSTTNVASSTTSSTTYATTTDVTTDILEGSNNIVNTIPKFVCKFCGISYKHKSSMYKHIANKHKQDNSEDVVPIIDTLKKEIEELKERLVTQQITPPSSQINNTTNNNNSPESKSNRANIPSRLRGSDTKYVYLIREREFCRMNEHIYKIGKSCEAKYARLDKYENGQK